METVTWIISAGVLFAFAGARMPAQGPLEVQAQESPATQQIQCVVKVTADADVMPLSFNLVEALLRTEAVAGTAAQRVLGEEHVAAHELFHIMPLPGPQSEPTRKPQTLLFSLWIDLPDTAGPAAREFAHALTEGLHRELDKAFGVHIEELERQRRGAEAQQEAARRELEGIMRQAAVTEAEMIRPDPADEAVHRQLDKTVDLSMLHPEMPVEEAFEILARCVDPPLKIVVLWRDLLDNADIDPSSPINMKGLRDIRLGTALENLVCAISNPLYPDYPIQFAVSRGVITVATVTGLPKEAMVTRTYDLPLVVRANRSADELIAIIQETIEPESWSAIYPESGNGAILSCADTRLVVRQSRGVHMRIQQLLRAIDESSPALPTSDIPEETLHERMQALLSYRGTLEANLNRLQERQKAIHTERNMRRSQVVESTVQHVITELRSTIRDLQITRFDTLGSEPNSPEFKVPGRMIDRIEQCIDRCDQIIRAFRPDALTFSAAPPWLDAHADQEEETLAKKSAGRETTLVQVSRRIAEIQRTLATPQTFDPGVSRMQRAAGRLARASERVDDLNTRLAELQPCSVVVLGDVE